MPEFCTINQIVAATGLDRGTVWRHKKRGLLRHEPTEGVKSLRFRMTQVEKWLNRYFPEKAKEALGKLR